MELFIFVVIEMRHNAVTLQFVLTDLASAKAGTAGQAQLVLTQADRAEMKGG